jgi:hypothetical protein
MKKQQSFEEVYAQHREGAINILTLKYGAGRADAEDAVEAAAGFLWQRWKNGKGPSLFFQTAAAQLNDMRRKGRGHRPKDPGKVYAQEIPAGDLYGRIASDDMSKDEGEGVSLEEIYTVDSKRSHGLKDDVGLSMEGGSLSTVLPSGVYKATWPGQGYWMNTEAAKPYRGCHFCPYYPWNKGHDTSCPWREAR